MSGIAWAQAWRIARRELRGAGNTTLIFAICLAIGVGTITGVNVLGRTVQDVVGRDAGKLMGGDVLLEQPHEAVDPAPIETFLEPGDRSSAVARVATSAYGPDGQRVTVALKAVDDAYPLYGEVATGQERASAPVVAPGHVLLEEALLLRLGLELGDPITIGDTDLTVAGTIEAEPDRFGGGMTLGPRVLMHWDDLDATGVVQPGSMVRFAQRIALSDPNQREQVTQTLRSAFPDASFRARSSRTVEPQVKRFADRLGSFLTIAGLTALLVGGIAIALSTRTYLTKRLGTIATLKSLGANNSLIVAAYGFQLLVLTLVGALVGVAIGQALPSLLALLFQNQLPIELELTWRPALLATGALLGLLTSACFTAPMLLAATDTHPARLFRHQSEALALVWTRDRVIWAAALALVTFATVLLAVPEAWIGAAFAAAAVASSLLLATAAHSVSRLARTTAKRARSITKLALAAIGKPRSDAKPVVIALGAAVAVLTLVGQLHANLMRELDDRLPERAPQAFLIDIQPEDRDRFEDLVAAKPEVALLQIAPMLRARIVRIKGVPVEQAPISPDVAWTVRRDRGLSFTNTMPADTRLVAGQWWDEDYDGPTLVSIEEDVAAGYGVTIGDQLSFNVLGRMIDAEIANIREEIDWSRGRMGFVFIMSPGLISQAPHTVIATVDYPKETEASFLADLADQLPNVTPIQVGAVVSAAADTLNRLGQVFTGVAGLTLVTGIAALAAAVTAAQSRHIYTAAVLNALGATRGAIARMVMIEYAALGVSAAFIGAIIGAIAAWTVTRFVFGLTWQLAIPSLAIISTLVVAATLIAALTVLRVVFRSSSLRSLLQA
ncbi:MAG: ABC transporter permease [Geminicoccaceae bacterium]